ncbi:MAG: HPP family protein [Gammaproteobacteria bacterium]|nr:HPP family protein [Gammaproteobacteria bacterium]
MSATSSIPASATGPFVRGGMLTAALMTVVYGAGISAMAAPFSATCVLLALMPQAPFSQPRTLLLAHVICIVLGAGFAALPLPAFVAVFGVVWLSIMLMAVCRAVHAPAVAHAVILTLGAQPVATYSRWALILAVAFAMYARVSSPVGRTN